jgi:hypothetical protein
MASKLTSLDIAEITRQADVLSKPIRDNNTSFKNKINEVIDELAAVAIGTTNAETTAARPYNTDLKERLDTITSGKPNYRDTITSLVTESTPNAMTVDIAAGNGQVSGITVKWAASTSGTITAPSVHPRIDIVVVNSDSTLSIVTGAEVGATPVVPTVASTQLALAKILLGTSTTAITNSLITNYNGYVWSQYGEIIALHPETKAAYLPNSFHYSPCDGVESFDTTYIGTGSGTEVPDLTDHRFLQGDTEFDSGGAADNELDLRHAHSVAGHTHQWYNHTGTDPGDGNDQTYNSGGTAIDLTIAGGPSTDDALVLGAKNVAVVLGVDGFTSSVALNSDQQLSATQDIRPQYFSVLYYMRIR